MAIDDWTSMLNIDGKNRKGVVFGLEYSVTAHEFRVNASHGQIKLTENFAATYRPIFDCDMSVADEIQAVETALNLATKIEFDLAL